MKSPLNILHLEDNPNDAKLVQAALEEEGITCETTCVKTRDDFVAALDAGGVDLVLSDFSMPGFDGLGAAEIVRTRWPTIPFIFVSGTLGEERAGAALKGGATDYILKSHLGRLASVVRYAVEDLRDETGGLPPICRNQDIAMFCLPLDGRWQTEAQLIGQSRLGSRIRRIYWNLAAAGYCDIKIVPILDELGEAEDFMRMYRATRKMRRAYGERLARQGFRPTSLVEPANPNKTHARNH